MYEGGGIASNSGASVRLLQGHYGRFTAQDVRKNINDDNVHYPASRLVSIENTVNKGGGACWDFEELKAIKAVCTENKLAFHLDGARLFNALVAKNETAKQYGGLFDTISICLSKGLGAPVGSLLLGSKEHIYKARRIRKAMGGGMRQAGFIAAAGLYALQNNIERLAQDHRNAQQVEQVLNQANWIEKVYPVETNIVIFQVHPQFAPSSLIQKLEEAGIKAISMGGQLLRFVFHLEQSQEDIAKLCETLEKIKL